MSRNQRIGLLAAAAVVVVVAIVVAVASGGSDGITASTDTADDALDRHGRTAAGREQDRHQGRQALGGASRTSR